MAEISTRCMESSLFSLGDRYITPASLTECIQCYILIGKKETKLVYTCLHTDYSDLITAPL